MAGILSVQQIQGLATAADSTTVEISSGHTLYAPGHVIQVKSVTGSTNASTSSSSSYSDVPDSISITPTSTSSKILILGSIAAESYSSGSDRGIRLRILRGSSVLQTSTYNLYMSNNTNQRISMVTMHYLDSPATTSATTYKFQFNTTGSSATARVNQYADSNITLMEIAG